LRLNWEQINTVFAYTRDCLTVDQIRLILGDDVDLAWMEVTEDDVGFNVLIAELGRRLPGFLQVSDWWDKVAQGGKRKMNLSKEVSTKVSYRRVSGGHFSSIGVC